MPADLHTEQTDAYRQLESMVNGFKLTALVYLAIRSGIVDTLQQEPRSLQHIATATNMPEQHLERALRALVAIGICDDVELRFSLTDIGQLLLRDNDLPLRSGLLVDVEQRWLSWQQLPLAISTGQPVFKQIHGLSPWAYREANPQLSNDFNHWLALETQRVARQIVPQLPLQGTETIADIGGGHGGLLRAVLDAFPHCSGVLFDLPAVVAQASNGTQAPRIHAIGGNFLNNIAIEADVFMLKSVLHDWADADSKCILANCRASMKVGQKLLIIERFIDDDTNPLEQAILDMQMLLLHGGSERTRAAYETLLNASGFIPVSCMRTPSGFFILECVPSP